MHRAADRPGDSRASLASCQEVQNKHKCDSIQSWYFDMRELVKIAKALSDETRVRMLKLLLERNICVREMQEIFHMSQSQVSRNLKILTDAGLLKRWREGKCVVYVADKDGDSRFAKVLLDALSESFSDNALVSQDRERLQQVVTQQVREKTH